MYLISLQFIKLKVTLHSVLHYDNHHLSTTKESRCLSYMPNLSSSVAISLVIS